MMAGSSASRDKASSWRGRRPDGRERGRREDALRNPNPAQQNQSPAQQNQSRTQQIQSPAQRNQNGFPSRRSRLFKGLRPFSRVAKPPFPRWTWRQCSFHSVATFILPHRTKREQQSSPFVKELSMRAEAAPSEHPSRRAFRAPKDGAVMCFTQPRSLRPPPPRAP